jgi:hypothetical protein
MAAAAQLTFIDTATFEQNIAAYSSELSKIDATLAPVLATALPALADETHEKSKLLDDLFAGLGTLHRNTVGTLQTNSVTTTTSSAPSAAPAVRWFLEGIEIEGFRGINNEGSPLALKFKPECVSSISAPNGVGKSSIFDALSFALRGKVAKLDRLLQAERPQDYYLNKFHAGGIGTVKLLLRPDNGGNLVPITVTRNAAGSRNVVGPRGIDAQALLDDLDREFVLLDAHTFQSFIDDKALDRGRAFSGLLGLARYSMLRQQLQALCNTRSFNAHFDTAGHAARKAAADRNRGAARAAITTDYLGLVKDPIAVEAPVAESQQRCQAALHSFPVLVDHCFDRPFMEVDIDACLGAIRIAEGGPKRERLGSVIREQSKWEGANKPLPSDSDFATLATFAARREDALKATSGDMLRKLYRLSEQIMSASGWPSPTLCPTCGKDDGVSVLDAVRVKLGQFDAVEAMTAAAATEWAARGWSELIELEKLTLNVGEVPRLRELKALGEAGTLSLEQAEALAGHFVRLRSRAAQYLTSLAAERAQLEKELPPSLVAVTTAVETARRLQASWRALETAEAESATEEDRLKRLSQLKTFLDRASAAFSSADSDMASERLKKVEPLFQDMFMRIMFSPMKPALKKPKGSEEVGIQLAEFWELTDVSAQALLSESYRNAFAVSVYLAAASLYGGAPRFIVLDDVTSSFDAGHQHHLVEVIRTRFSRPVNTDGPQVIILSHDTLLEKLFNKLAGYAEWSHQRLEGTARTAVLLQSGAVNKVRDTTMDLLRAGRVDDAAPRIRQYLEYVLHSVIDRCRIPVPIDLAFGDDKRTPGEYLKAIEAAVELEGRAGTLILELAQVQALRIHSSAIIGNFLAHWSTGQTQAFSAPALLGVMQAIADFPECFKFEPTPGVPKKFYSSLSRR